MDRTIFKISNSTVFVRIYLRYRIKTITPIILMSNSTNFKYLLQMKNANFETEQIDTTECIEQFNNKKQCIITYYA